MMLDNLDNSSETTLETFNALIEHGYPPPNPIRSTHTLNFDFTTSRMRF